jgi:hypothetical protein
VLISVPLPQTPPERSLIVEAGQLFRERDKTPAVGRWLFAGNQQMQVIRHEAVRSNCESFIACCAQNMRTHNVHAHGLNERLMPVIRAVRQKIRVFTEVVEALEVRLKPHTTMTAI